MNLDVLEVLVAEVVRELLPTSNEKVRGELAAEVLCLFEGDPLLEVLLHGAYSDDINGADSGVMEHRSTVTCERERVS